MVDQLVGYSKDGWNFPGGGIDKEEIDEQALFRELREELGTTKFKILSKSDNSHVYNWPWKLVLKKSWNNKGFWRGQSQRHFLVKFTGKRSEIKIDPGEIRKIKWIKRIEFKKYLKFPYQLENTENELKNFK